MAPTTPTDMLSPPPSAPATVAKATELCSNSPVEYAQRLLPPHEPLTPAQADLANPPRRDYATEDGAAAAAQRSGTATRSTGATQSVAVEWSSGARSTSAPTRSMSGRTTKLSRTGWDSALLLLLDVSHQPSTPATPCPA